MPCLLVCLLAGVLACLLACLLARSLACLLACLLGSMRRRTWLCLRAA
jgi:hypothetical protein